ncbi:MAG: hypothetical protein ACPGSL_07630 [Vicingaceae bacterium]
MQNFNIKDKMSAFVLKNKHPFLLVLTILICLWPLSLFMYIPKWDNVNGYLPYRYFISDYLWNGHLPLWNPFQRLGYPGYADLQSGAWSPIVWIIMLFGKYTMNALIVELLSCYAFAGLGMYLLSNYLFKDKKTSLILGFSYALSGFMVGSSQLMVFLIAVTWFPWCVYALLQFFKTFYLKYQLLAAFFMALFITGASPAYTIILAYIVIGFFIYHLIISKNNNYKKILFGGAVMLCTLTILILPYIFSFLDFASYFNRSEKLVYDGFLLANPFTPISYVSFLMPHAVIAQSDWFNITDLTLRNGYFGFIPLIAAFSALLSKITRFKIILIIGIVLSLLLAAGDQTFLFKFLYHLPGFGIFRHPSIFRAFTIFCALLLAGNELKEIINKEVNKRVKIAFMVFVSVVCIGGVWAFSKTSFTEVAQLVINTINFQEKSSSALSTHLLLNTVIILGLVILVLSLKKVFKFSWFVALVVFCFLDVSIQTNLSAPTTVVYNFTNQSLAQYFDEIPNEISQKELDKPMGYFNDTQGLKSVNGIWQNVATFNKTISSTGVNPMRFRSFDDAKEDGRLNEALNHQLIYFVDTALKTTSTVVDYNAFSAIIENNTNTDKQLVLNQNYHHLWNASINNETLPILPHKGLTMEVVIPKNSSGKITFEYKSPKIIYTFIVSLLGYVLILLFVFKKKLKQ